MPSKRIRRFVIERKYIGSLKDGPLLRWHSEWTEWHIYARFKTAESRDAAIKKLLIKEKRDYFVQNFKYRAVDEPETESRKRAKPRKQLCEGGWLFMP